jgi:D-serine dehydratase
MDSLLHGGLALSSLEEQVLLPGTKGLPITAPLRQGAIGVQGWNVLHGDTSYPVAVLKTSALRHNLAWMRAFCERNKASLAPHGKTTMCPQLFGAQLAHGAWGITLATAAQVQVAHRFGVRRVILANQLVARSDVRAVLQLLHDDPDFECFVLADSLAGVARLAEEVDRHPLARPLPVLVELGLMGKRAGCRTLDEALTVARAVEHAPGLALAGFEGYEGCWCPRTAAPTCARWRNSSPNSVRWCARPTTKACSARRNPDHGRRLVLFRPGRARLPGSARPVAALRPVLRSGCYVTSDHGMYLDACSANSTNAKASTRAPACARRWKSGAWCSRVPNPAWRSWRWASATPPTTPACRSPAVPPPRSGHAALPAGRLRDRQDERPACLPAPAGRTDPCALLAVGDLVGCGISHPCTTFDRWPLLLGVDDDYAVRFGLNTFF